MGRYAFYIDIPTEQVQWVADTAGLSFKEANKHVKAALKIYIDRFIKGREPRVTEGGVIDMVEPDPDDRLTYSGRYARDDNGLTPPDLDCCQAEKPNGHSAFTLGGVPRRVRCTNKPRFIATETTPGDDGLTGRMSLCAPCRKVFEKQMPEGYATFEEIERA